MARGNGDLNRWVAAALVERMAGPVDRVVELGPGPGVGLAALHEAFPHARLWGLDRSPLMVRRARRRTGRLADDRVSVELGDVTDLARLAPVDLIVAVHVLYFWADPAGELGTIREALGEGGTLALGYQTHERMPTFAQRNFPTAGHRLYDDDAVQSLTTASGFSSTELVVKHGPSGEEGRVLLARR
jgi:trans-aconitate methyltransferase